MRATTLASVTVSGALVLSGIAMAPASQAASSDIVIGVEAPLTGAQASNGQDMLRGVKLAVAQANAKGGVMGRKVRIVELDDQADPNKAAAMVTKAKAAGVTAVVGPYNSSVGILNLPLYLKAGIVPVHMTSTNDTDGMGVTVQPKNNQISPIESAYATSIGAKNDCFSCNGLGLGVPREYRSSTPPLPALPALHDADRTSGRCSDASRNRSIDRSA